MFSVLLIGGVVAVRFGEFVMLCIQGSALYCGVFGSTFWKTFFFKFQAYLSDIAWLILPKFGGIWKAEPPCSLAKLKGPLVSSTLFTGESIGLRIIRYHKWGTSLMTLCNTPRSVPKAGRSNTLFPNKYQYVQLDISISMTCGT
ncbi:hypothetical protein LguiB_028075 [Lonicera macranthoides]